MDQPQGYFPNSALELIVLRFIEQYGLTRHIEEPMSKLDVACHQIITEQFRVEQLGISPSVVSTKEEQRAIKTISFNLTFTNTAIRPSKRGLEGYMHAVPLDPWWCLSEKKTYSVDLFVTCRFEATLVMRDGTEQTKVVDVPEQFVCAIPIEVGGVNCSTHGRTRQQIYQQHSDPDVLRGMFIIGGSPFCIHTRGYTKFNMMQVSRNAYRNEVSRASMICREGIYKNSFQIMLRHLRSGLLTIEIASYPYDGHQIPVHLFFYMLGVSNDQKIEEMVVMSREDNATTRMLRQTLTTSYLMLMSDARFAAVRTTRLPQDIMEWYYTFSMEDRNIGEHRIETLDKTKKVNKVSNMLDTMFLVNQSAAGCGSAYGGPRGATGGVSDAFELRDKKARILASMIHDTIMTSEQKIAGTDRDHLANLNMQTPAVLLMRTLKTEFHEEVVKKLRDDFRASFTTQEFASVNISNIVRNRLSKLKLSEKFEKEIKAIQDKNAPPDNERVIHSEAMNPVKSQIHALAAKRTITVRGIQSKVAERSREIRQVHASYAEFICYITSPDTGENVGMPKQLAIMTAITSYLNPLELQGQVYAYPGLVRWMTIDDADMKRYTHVYINGDWCGGLVEPYGFLKHFRDLRRRNGIDRSISIRYLTMSNRIEFGTDDGRLIRPFFIVYNNSDELDAFDGAIAAEVLKLDASHPSADLDALRKRRDDGRPQFKQWVRYDATWHAKLIAGEVTFEDLVTNGIMEYITADEMQNCYLASSHADLWRLRHEERKPFTHMTIPLSAFGVPALTGTLPHLSQPLRHTFQTQMCKQTTGFSTILEPYLDTKQMHCQMMAHMPVNPTFANNFTDPGGAPVVIAFMCARWNQDDSIVMKEEFIERGGFLCTTISKIICECRTANEFIGLPESLGAQIKTANYSKLKAGKYVEAGTRIEDGDVIVAKHLKLDAPDGSKTFIDKSEVYHHHEPAYVTGVFVHTINGIVRVTVQYRIERIPNTGSKFASRSGNKGVISRREPESHLPAGLVTGRVADIYINPHSFPSRMLPGETISDWLGKLATSTYRVIQVTPFMDLDFGVILEAMKAAGQQVHGLEPMRDGRTGFITQPLFITTTTRQCLQKFAEAEASARSTGKLSPITRQSLMGAQNSGGQRSGEMEMWVTGGHGTAAVLDEFQKFGSTYFNVPVCRRCNQRAIHNSTPHPKTGKARNLYLCRGCKENANIVLVRTKFMTNSFVAYLESMGIRVDLKTEPFVPQTFS